MPQDPTERLEWSVRAGEVAAYRERFSFEDPDKAIGHAPGRGAPEQRAAWEQAYAALGRPVELDDTVAMTRGQLLNHVQTYERIEAWMPPDVSDRFRASLIAQRDYQAEADQHRAAGRDSDADRTAAIAEAFRTKAADYEQIDAVRREAEARYEAERDLANRAAVELQRREPEREEDHEPQQEIVQPEHEREHEPATHDEPVASGEPVGLEHDRHELVADKTADERATNEAVEPEPIASGPSKEERAADQTVEDARAETAARLHERADIDAALGRAREVAGELAEDRQRREREQEHEREAAATPEVEVPDTGQSIEVE